MAAEVCSAWSAIAKNCLFFLYYLYPLNLLLLLLLLLRLVFQSAVWYSTHLQLSGHEVPIVIVTEHPQVCCTPLPNLLPLPFFTHPPIILQAYTSLLSTSPAVRVHSMSEYLALFWSDLTDVAVLYESMLASRREREREEEGRLCYPRYLPLAQLKQGLREVRRRRRRRGNVSLCNITTGQICGRGTKSESLPSS